MMSKKYFDDLVRDWIKSGMVASNEDLTERVYAMLLEISEVRGILRTECEPYDNLKDSYETPALKDAVDNLKGNAITLGEAKTIVKELYDDAHDYVDNGDFDKSSIRRKLSLRKDANQKFDILSDLVANGIPDSESDRKLKKASERFERRISREMDNRHKYEL